MLACIGIGMKKLHSNMKLKAGMAGLLLLFSIVGLFITACSGDLDAVKDKPEQGALLGNWVLTKDATAELNKYIVRDWTKSKLVLGADGTFDASQFPAEKQAEALPISVFDGHGRWQLEEISNHWVVFLNFDSGFGQPMDIRGKGGEHLTHPITDPDGNDLVAFEKSQPSKQ